MQPRFSRLAKHGAVGGAMAGAVVMVWFLVLDLLASQPVATPTLLASALLDRETARVTVGVLVTYTVLHYGVFVALGVGAAFALRLLGIVPGLRHGAIFGVSVLNAVHYSGFLVTDAQVLTALPYGHVIAANTLGGMALMAYLHHVEHVEQPLGLGMLAKHRLLARGIVTGLVGAAAVAVWFLLLDIFAGRPFFTPAALASAVLVGASSPGDVQTSAGLVAAYTVIHVTAFVVVGLALVWVSERIEHTPGLWLLALMGFIVVEAGFLGVVGVLGGWLLGTIGFAAVLVGNVLSVASMGRWIWVTHPGLKEQLVEQPVATMV